MRTKPAKGKSNENLRELVSREEHENARRQNRKNRHSAQEMMRTSGAFGLFPTQEKTNGKTEDVQEFIQVNTHTNLAKIEEVQRDIRIAEEAKRKAKLPEAVIAWTNIIRRKREELNNMSKAAFL